MQDEQFSMDSLAVTNQVGHFCKTTTVFGQVLKFHLLATKLKPNYTVEKERKRIRAPFTNLVKPI